MNIKNMSTKELYEVICDHCHGKSCSNNCLIREVCTQINGRFNYPENRKELEEAYLILNPNVGDSVNHPSHYNQGGMECIDEMVLIFGKEATMNFCLCNAWKYRYRANAKNGQEDLDKANWYLAKYKELKEQSENAPTGGMCR